jgi:hypothetical protein
MSVRDISSMKANWRIVGLLVGSLLAAGCSTTGSSEGQGDACSRTFGAPGLDWLGKETPKEELVRDPAHDVAEAQKYIQEKMRAWRPSAEGEMPPSLSAANLCTVRIKGDPSKLFHIHYAATHQTFENVGVLPEKNLVRLSSTSTLEYGTMSGIGPSYHVYVKCQIPGARQGQAEAWPLVLRMVDRLTGTRDTREAVTHALGAARLMVKLLECENRPVVPRTPPASVGG